MESIAPFKQIVLCRGGGTLYLLELYRFLVLVSTASFVGTWERRANIAGRTEEAKPHFEEAEHKVVLSKTTRKLTIARMYSRCHKKKISTTARQLDLSSNNGVCIQRRRR